MKIRILLLALVLCALPAFAQAGDPGSGSFGFQFGWNLPEAGFSNYADSGYNGSIDLTYNLSKKLAFRTEFGRAYNDINSGKIAYVSGYSSSVYNYNLTENVIFTLNPDADTNVYLIAGLGGHRVTAEVGSYNYYGTVYPPYWGYPWYGYPVYGYNAAASRTTTRWGYNAGVGVQFKISPGFTMSLESRYTWVATQHNIEYIPIAIGFRFM
jgi:opacity protein-like surface antigen